MQAGWGLALVVAAGASYWWATNVWEQPDPSGLNLIYYSHGASGEAVRARTQRVAIIAGVLGLLILMPALLRRIPRRGLRLTAGWASVACAILAVPYLALMFFAALFISSVTDYTRFEAGDGQSVVVTQDGFDGDSVSIYTEHDDTHYVFAQQPSDLTGLPRVKDRSCYLAADDGQLLLTCGTDTTRITTR
jgi:hypothetical protein